MNTSWIARRDALTTALRRLLQRVHSFENTEERKLESSSGANNASCLTWIVNLTSSFQDIRLTVLEESIRRYRRICVVAAE